MTYAGKVGELVLLGTSCFSCGNICIIYKKKLSSRIELRIYFPQAMLYILYIHTFTCQCSLEYFSAAMLVSLANI
jgi:hypothetical protein